MKRKRVGREGGIDAQPAQPHGEAERRRRLDVKREAEKKFFRLHEGPLQVELRWQEQTHQQVLAAPEPVSQPTDTFREPIVFDLVLDTVVPSDQVKQHAREQRHAEPYRIESCQLWTELWPTYRKRKGRLNLNLFDPSAQQLASIPWSLVRRGQHLEHILPALIDMQLDRTARLSCSCCIEQSAEAVSIQISVTVKLCPQPPSRRLSLVLEGALLEKKMELGQMPTTASSPWFYSHLQPSSHSFPPSIQHSDLKPALLPFQKRTVAWMLAREGVVVKEDGELSTLATPLSPLLHMLDETKAGNDAVWASPATGEVFTRTDHLPKWTIQGGILAEEMGLGKTVEFLSVILLHPGKDRVHLGSLTHVNNESCQPIGATLIVAPAAILSQWADEIKRHCPKLNVFIFQGTRDFETRVKRNWVEFSKDLDIVLCDYGTLRQELYFATPDSSRSRRFDRKFARPISPLVQVEWWRVGMDEVQMVENANNIKELMSLIPRVSCWAISGTPIKKNIEDLQGVFGFLRCDLAAPVASSNSVFKRLLEPNMGPFLQSILDLLAVRTTKKLVQEELKLPRQSRHLVPLQLSDIERSYYNQYYDDACKDLEVDHAGLSQEGNNIDYVKMQSWVLRLRQIICHPQIADRDRRQLLGSGHHQMVQSIDQVLKMMMNQTTSLVYSKRRSLLQGKIRHALVMQHDERNADRLEIVLPIFLTIESDLKSSIKEIRNDLLKRETEENSFGPEQPGKVETIFSKSHDDANLQHRLRDWLEVQHTLSFLLGNLYFQLGEKELAGKIKDEKETHEDREARQVEPTPDKAEPRIETQWTKRETDAYDFAEVVRREYLKSTEEAALAAIVHMKAVLFQGPRQYTDLEVKYLDEKGGIYSHDIIVQVNDTIDHMTEAAETIWNWRGQGLVDLLCRPFVHLDDPDGEEYQKDLDTQENLSAYLDIYPQLLADRRQLLTGELSHLTISNEIKSPTKRTMAREDFQDLDSVKNAKNRKPVDKTVEIATTDSIRPTLLETRRRLRHPREMRYLRHLMLELKSQSQMAVRREEIELCQDRQRHLNKIIHAQVVILDKLFSELEEFQKVFNLRALYFKQLQILSDEVQGLDIKDFDIELKKCQAEVTKLSRETQLAESRSRYLDHLNRMQHQDYTPEDRQCGICYSTFDDGIITPCAHIFCSPDFSKWSSKHRQCPICQTLILPGSVSRITFDKEGTKNELSMSDFELDSLSTMSKETLEEIQKMPIKGSWGTKIDMLLRHIKSNKSNCEPGSGDHKCIVYSTWASALAIVQLALDQNAISYVKLDTKGPRHNNGLVTSFQQDPSIDVFILHAKTQSAGLTLTAAKYVFLLEPMYQQMHELQAIGRTHRIGQTQPTHVFQYFCPRTVDSRVVHLAKHRGHSLFSKVLSGGEQQPIWTDPDTEASVNEILISSTVGGEEVESGKRQERLEWAAQEDLFAIFSEEKLKQIIGPSSSSSGPIMDNHRGQSLDDLAMRRMQAATAAEMRLAKRA